MRKFGIVGLASVVLMACVGSLAALQGLWTLSVFLVYGTVVMTALMILLASRYTSRLIRTETRKSLAAIRDLTALVERYGRENESRMNTQRQLLEANQEVISSVKNSTETTVVDLEHGFGQIESVVRRVARSNAQHVSSTVRHGTNEVEALLQIFPRLPQTRFPMPTTGGWAIDAQALARILSLVGERKPKRILELGSGSSTIWLAYLCRSYGGELTALDHLSEYLDQTRAAIALHDLADHVDVRLAPLEQIDCHGEDYLWYSPQQLGDLSDIDMLIVDGPPASTGPKARYPALPQTADLLSGDVTVILDDAHRRDEIEIIESWQTRFPEFSKFDVGVPGLAILQRGF